MYIYKYIYIYTIILLGWFLKWSNLIAFTVSIEYRNTYRSLWSGRLTEHTDFDQNHAVLTVALRKL